MKRLIVITVFLTILISQMFVFPVSSAGTVDISIQPPVKTVSVGETFDVTIQIDASTQPVAGVDTFLNFDVTKLEVINITPDLTRLGIPANLVMDNTLGYADYSGLAFPGVPPPIGTFNLATITFKAITETPGTLLTFSNVAPRETVAAFEGLDVTGAVSGGNVIIFIVPSIDNLDDTIEYMLSEGLIDNAGIGNSLLSQVSSAKSKIEHSQIKPAVNILNAFINHVSAQRGKHIAPKAADKLIADAQYIIAHL